MESQNQSTVNPSPWSGASDALCQAYATDSQGLAPSEVSRRLQVYGPNRLELSRARSVWSILLAQFKSLMVLFLLLAVGLSALLGDRLEAVAIVVVILINALIGFVTELRATRSMEALRSIGAVTTRVRRGGSVRERPADELVPGDIVVLEGGDVVTADLRLLTASRLQVDESTLTGESMPVSKGLDPLPVETPLAERRNMLYRGTSVTRGSAEALVVATGMATELGRIAAMVAASEEDELTPLEQRLDRMGRRLIWMTLVVTAFVALSGILAGKSLWLMVQTGIALAVATIPEGLPVVATIALARGMWRMARRNALINKLSAVETLGATSVICTDKTGTLTENRMTVRRYWLADREVEVSGEGDSLEGGFYQHGHRLMPGDCHGLNEALRIGALCSNASLEAGRRSGDPLELALLVAAAKAGMAQEALRESWPELREEAFDPATSMMATAHADDGAVYVAVKGAPEAVLGRCNSVLHGEGELSDLDEAQRSLWQQRNEAMAASGLRVLALARKQVATAEGALYGELAMVGLVGLQDPPRRDVGQAIADCHAAGMRVVMITGDQGQTALSVALAVGLVEEADAEVIHGRELDMMDRRDPEVLARLLACRIFCRVTPEEKLGLIALHQGAGQVVAMTGDGVNDAPALKKADIGVAMGKRGTQVAREASDMVLKDDAFSTITAAIQQGRIIFNNIRRFVVYLLSCNLSEVMVVGLAALFNAPLPLLPMQILFLNLVTDVFPALALGMGEGDRDVMHQPPRPRQEAILTAAHWWGIFAYGAMITLSVLGLFFAGLYWFRWPHDEVVTMTFMCIALAQLWHVFNMRSVGSHWLRNDVMGNPYVWAALLLCIGLVLAYLVLPVLGRVLALQPLSAEQWGWVVAASVLPYFLGQLFLSVARRPQ